MKVNIGGFTFSVWDDFKFWTAIDTWEPYSLNILNKYLNKDNVFIDVGAWNGVLSMYGSRIAKYVHSFEPDPVAYSKIVTNTKLNNIDNHVIIKAGCSNKDGVQTLHIRNKGDSTSSLIDRVMDGYKTQSTIDINTIRLSRYLIDNDIQDIGIIKVDIEGGEIFLIEEMAEYIRTHKPTMYISFHPNWFPDKEKNILDMMDVLSCYKNIYNRSMKRITINDAIQGLNKNNHELVFSNDIKYIDRPVLIDKGIGRVRTLKI